MFEWYTGMIDEGTRRLLYLYDPESGTATGDGEPIRDIAAVWDVEVLSAFLGRNDNAFLALALSRSELPDKVLRLTPLTEGILRQQRSRAR
jgi:hypothetical protein